MAMKGFVRQIKPMEILSEEQCQAIHRATLDVLQNVGMRVDHKRALSLLEKNDCQVDYKNGRVKFPPGLVEECLRRAPSSFRVKARDPKNDIIMGGNTIYFGPAPGKQTVDINTWEPREATRQETYDGLVILDALPNVHFLPSYTPYFGFEGIPPVMRIPEICAAKIRNSTKWFFEGYSNDCEIFVIQMAQALGIDIMCSMLASPPLTWYGEAVECAFRAAEAGLPVRVLTGPVCGATAPATVAGSAVTANAEIIAGVVLLQLMRPGMRVEVKDFTYPQNMRTGAPAFANIGVSLHGAVFSQMWRRYGIPAGMTTAYPSSKIPDFQCGYEKAIIALVAALSGINLQLVQGAIHGELTHHPVQAIIDDDLVGMIGRFLEGVEVNDETLALDVITETGPIPGEFLSKGHTRKWWRREQYVPQVADVWTYPEWQKRGKKSCVQYAKEKMEEILATHKPTPLPANQEKDIEKILEDARKFYKNKGMM
jgi:trimethylamine---corrinoid protein Co-methyltransferase